MARRHRCSLGRHRRLLVLVAGYVFAALVWLGVLTVQQIRGELAQGRVYTVAAVRAGLVHNSEAWVGRTLVIRALAAPCPWWRAVARLQHCAGRQLVLVDTIMDLPIALRPLVRPAPNPLWAFLGRLPLLGRLLARIALEDPFAPARYRVRLQTLPSRSCAGFRLCYQVVLLAETPVTPEV